MAATQVACTGRARLKGCGGQGTRGAHSEQHSEHAVHGRDLGRVEAERLVERLRALPSQKAGMRDGEKYIRPGRREGALGGGDTSGVCTRRDRLKAGGGQGTRGAHVEHGPHGRDLGRVEAERLVERLRVLPSRKAGMAHAMWGEVQPGRCEGVVGGGDASGTHGEGPAWARAERTRNMRHMVVTLDVLKLSGWLNAGATCRVERRGHATREAMYGPGGVRGGGDAIGMHGEGPTQGFGAPAERTWNIQPMLVTLDVSKLSGWLNALAYCRVEGRACDAGRDAAREA